MLRLRRLRVQGRLTLRLLAAVARGDRRAGLLSRHWLQVLAFDLRELPGRRRARCPVCGWAGRSFFPYVSGASIFPAAECPTCDSKPRHRTLALLLQREAAAVGGRRRVVLDVAPTPSFSPALRRLPGIRYLSTDLSSPFAMVRADLRRFALRTDSIDLLVCYHVLEHVVEDRAAMRELARVLRPGAVGYVQVPVDPALEKTEEWGRPDPELHGHVRQYGRDFHDRLREEGFRVEVIDASAFAGPGEMERHGLTVEPFCRVQIR